MVFQVVAYYYVANESNQPKNKILIRIDVNIFISASLFVWMIVSPKHHTPIN